MKKLIMISPEEIQVIIKQTIKESLSENLESTDSKKVWLTKDELISMTRWSARTIQYLRDSRQIPFSQHGRKILYPYSGILQFLERNTVTPKASEVLR